MNTKLPDVISFIFSQEFSSEDHNRIVNALKDRARMRSQMAKHQFTVGDKVEFNSDKRNMTVKGTVLKIARSTVHVREEPGSGFPGVTWRVSPSLLRKAGPTAKEVNDYYNK